jgi:autotransporter-associated beta strand protein
VDLAVSADNGSTWTTLATNVSLDAYGNGSFTWTVPATAAPGNQYLVRVAANGVSNVAGLSGDFLVASSGSDFYVAATGNNANSGKTPDQPMASLAALLAAYNADFQPGDTIYVASGSYDDLQNLVLGPQLSGVTIQGPTGGGAAVLNRGNTNSSQYVFELAGAQNVTLDDLTITGGSCGIYAASTADSTYLTVSDCQLYGNANDDIFLDASNDHALLSGNTVYDAPTGISVAGSGDTVSGNTVYATATGIYSYLTTAGVAGVTISGNTVYDNSSAGIYIYGNALATGIEVSSGGVARQNVAYDNYYGISMNWGGQLLDNRVYDNSQAGIYDSESGGVIQANTVYSNGAGVQLAYGGSLQLDDNLIYANVNQGILVNSDGYWGSTRIVNNTIYQPVGDAVRIQGGSYNVSLLNNILYVLAGYDLYVALDSQTGFASNYNLFFLGTVPGPKAHLGFWNNATVDLGQNPAPPLSNWQSGSGQDGNSVYGDPLFVDPAGADGVLGYDPVHNYDGGLDDNFSLSAGSPAINRGATWGAPPTDITGAARYDDPGTPNQGGSDYVAQSTSASIYATGALGTAQNRHGSDTYYTLNLPFAFSFYGTSYTTVQVSTSGFLQFAGNDSAGDDAPAAAKLLDDARIAPLWMDLSTSGPGNDIFVDTSVSGQVTVRWQATSVADGSQVDFAVVLFSNGTFRFDYGPGNANVASAVIGISAGNGDNYQIAGYTGQSPLTAAASLLYTLQPGFVDIGAYQFLGNSLDTTPPAVTGTTPGVVDSSGATTASFQQLQLALSEPLNPIDANAPAAFQLLGHQGSGAFGGPGDTVYALVPQYVPGSTTLALSIVVPGGGDLPVGNYQFTVFGAVVHDLSGLELAGAGTAGTNYVRTFSIQSPLIWSFDGTTQLAFTNDLPDGSLVSGITFGPEAGPYVLGGNAIDLNGDIASQGPNVQTINLPVTLIGGNRTIDVASGTVAIAGSIGQSGGSVGITKTGSGTLVFSAANTYGGTAVLAGVLQITNAAALPDGSTLTIGADASQLFGASQAAPTVLITPPTVLITPPTVLITLRRDGSAPDTSAAAQAFSPMATAASRPAAGAAHDLVLQEWMNNHPAKPAAASEDQALSSGPAATRARDLVIGAGPGALQPDAAWLWDLIDSQDRKDKSSAVAAIDKLLETY